MKKTLLLLTLFFVTISLNAQFTLEDADGNLISDGTTLYFDSYEYPDASWEFHVNNTSDVETIRMKIEFVDAVNTNGSMMELCFGLCYTGISIGQILPPGNDFVEILPGQQTGDGNHIFNSDPGNGVDPISYIFRFFQIDESGNEIGQDLTITYVYDPTLNVNENSKLNFSIQNTIVNQHLIIDSQEDLSIQIFDVLGKQVLNKQLKIGLQQIDLSHLNPQFYFVNLTNNKGTTEVIKILKK